MLVEVKDCLPVLRCPRTRSVLTPQSTNVLTCAAGHEYQISNGKPVLIDFTDSVLSEADVTNTKAGSQIERKDYGGLKGKLKRLLSPEKRETLDNVRRLIADLDTLDRPARLLVVGGGSIGQGMRALYENSNISIFSFDIYDSPYVQFIADGHHMPLPDDFFDGVVVQAVLEHVLQPAQVVSEIWRVLRPDGFVYAETPFMQQVHEGPYDFTRFTESGHRYLFRHFAHLSSGSNGGPGVQFMWSIDHLVRGIFRSAKAGKIAKLAFFWVQYLDRLIPPAYAQDGASGVFFYGKKSLKPVSPSEIIAYYRGAQVGA